MDIDKILQEGGFETVRLDTASVRKDPVWECKIGLSGGKSVALPGGCDLPMRQAVEAAFRQITGQNEDFNFSGWGAEMTPSQRATLDNRSATVEEAFDVAGAVKALGDAMRCDPEEGGYRYGWQANLAMMMVDAGVSHEEANKRANGFLKMAFDA